MNSHSNRETAAVALSLLDLTNLKDDCTEAQIDALCARAQTPFGNSAAICIWPRFVAHARNILGTGHPVRIATVVNFPSGGMEAADVAAEAIARRFGRGSVDGKIQAHVVSVEADD